MTGETVEKWAEGNGCRLSMVCRGGIGVGVMAWGPPDVPDLDIDWRSEYRATDMDVRVSGKILFARTPAYVACWRLSSKEMALDWASSLVFTRDAVSRPTHPDLQRPIKIRLKDRKECTR